MALQLISSAFEAGGMIPARYTCDGANVSPPLSWEGVPPNAKSLALICDDPDAPMGTWVHWVLFDLPTTITQLPEDVPPKKNLANSARQGLNDFRKIGYGGPCPPGGIHRYFFRLYALDTFLNLPPGVTKAELLKAMEGHILEQAELIGKYGR
ncbi:MAG: YbhB/YbcL family Raf kinase inhibitor-like protein [Calditrichaeota bacterium]|nr:YbhB/YbcL family Raf kinase inhibitor-like protein [Calditrichota bacterium]